MEVCRDLDCLRERVRAWQHAGDRIGFVPTMGNLHDGHMSLLEMSKAENERTVVSIFVNPIQFGKGEDYQRYPSTLDVDRTRLAARQASLLFTPDLDALYPGGTDTDTRITVPELSDVLCGEYRPGHFSGVATVVTKLLINVRPDAAYFGEKDYQQLLVIRRLARDLCLPVTIRSAPIIREPDGLAMSSRNIYLGSEERARATLLYRVLTETADAVIAGEDLAELSDRGMARLSAGGFRPEYLAIRRATDLAEPSPADRELRILVAAWLGGARLIDNLAVERLGP